MSTTCTILQYEKYDFHEHVNGFIYTMKYEIILTKDFTNPQCVYKLITASIIFYLAFNPLNKIWWIKHDGILIPVPFKTMFNPMLNYRIQLMNTKLMFCKMITVSGTWQLPWDLPKCMTLCEVIQMCFEM